MNWNYVFRRRIFGPPLRWIFPTKVVGIENLPEGPFILAAGPHKTLKESMIIPVQLWDHELHFLAKGTLWKVPVVGTFLSATRQIPVDRTEGRGADAIGPAVADLKNGYSVMIYPEGTRHKGDDGVHLGKTGVARIAFRAEVPIVPVALVGMRSMKRSTHREIRIGKPINTMRVIALSDRVLARRSEETIIARRVTDRVMEEIRTLLENPAKG